MEVTAVGDSMGSPKDMGCGVMERRRREVACREVLFVHYIGEEEFWIPQ
jgi:hypothetical protein